MNFSTHLQKVLESKNSNQPSGVFSVCSSNSFVLDASIKEAKNKSRFLLVESTCNQVNQFGGYTGLKPLDFVSYIKDLGEKNNFSEEFLFLGGDHLGPSVWKHLPSKTAMDYSTELVKQYVRAGYKKIHFDASMSCFDDPVPLPPEIVSEREAELCSAAIKECEKNNISLSEMCFVIGTEVPTPGGTTDEDVEIEISDVQETKRNIEHTREIFFKFGLEKAWEKTFAFVVQPGVEFGNSTIHPYNRQMASGLTELIEKYDNIIYEAHSTDYQLRKHLREMVEDHFAILKVGPALTYAFREAILSLEAIEKEVSTISAFSLSNIGKTLENEMCKNPDYWKSHYSSDPNFASFQRKYSLLDRARYYWTNPEVESALNQLLQNLSTQQIPLSILSQMMPEQYEKIRAGEISNSPEQLIHDKITRVLDDYFYATGI